MKMIPLKGINQTFFSLSLQAYMGRILAIDYGTKRCGLAVTDPLQIIPCGLETVSTKELIGFLNGYLLKEQVERVIIGYPRKMNYTLSDNSVNVDAFARSFVRLYPAIPLEYVDERFTSVLAQKAIIASGVNKKTRQEKGLYDKVSAVIILQSYLERKKI